MVSRGGFVPPHQQTMRPVCVSVTQFSRTHDSAALRTRPRSRSQSGGKPSSIVAKAIVPCWTRGRGFVRQSPKALREFSSGRDEPISALRRTTGALGTSRVGGSERSVVHSVVAAVDGNACNEDGFDSFAKFTQWRTTNFDADRAYTKERNVHWYVTMRSGNAN